MIPEMNTAHYWIEQLDLTKHPEGGYFRETYRSEEMLSEKGLPGRFTGPRSCSTAIYFLLEGDDFSAFHRIKSDEVWHFYRGSSMTIHVLAPDNGYSVLRLGPDPDKGHALQAVVHNGSWFGATIDNKDSFTLVGCTVSPGFDFRDFEMAKRDPLHKKFPRYKNIIDALTIA